MFDSFFRPHIENPLRQAARVAITYGVTANGVTWAGFGIGLICLPALALGAYELALVCLVINRLADGLDGAIARETTPTDFGAYLDITLDFIFYAGFVLGFGLGAPGALPYAALLLFTFMATGSSFLAYAIFAERYGVETSARGQKSFYHLGGLMEGSETIAFFVLFILFPSWFPVLASLFAALCLVTAAGRIYEAAQLTGAKKSTVDPLEGGAPVGSAGR